ncbi:hypothetical protein A1507_18780 [Methylomonas koyamae]|uniref:Uncharacterized protein n=1 Tax=Methylomonas koyamae TaxID=702114 RepID=A0A177N4J0_9GAMM|nr:hypothetical protein A1507_18780 [Methylomonas koyamae]
MPEVTAVNRDRRSLIDAMTDADLLLADDPPAVNLPAESRPGSSAPPPDDTRLIRSATTAFPAAAVAPPLDFDRLGTATFTVDALVNLPEASRAGLVDGGGLV